MRNINKFRFREATFFYIVLLFVNGLSLSAQNTVGLLDFDKEQVSPGYNLIYPNNQSSVYLLDNCGQIINEWTDDKEGRPGIMAELLDDGSIIRASSNGEEVVNSFGAGGSGGVIDRISWEGETLWHYVLADSTYRQHHEFKVMPNGNILFIVWKRHFLDEIVANGFDTLNNAQKELWSDSIFEIDPDDNSVVWRWNSWDHLVQDYDVTKENFGDVSLSVNKIDVNYHEYSFGKKDFMHCNAVDYNEELDQIVISNKNFNEIWIIDHSLTTEEAATDAGDLLFRWGNPAAYKAGDSNSRQSFNQHNVHWINDFVDLDSPYYGLIGFYNNFIETDLSLGHIIAPVWNATAGTYEKNDSVFLPLDYAFEFSHPDTLKNYSTAASNIQFLESGNVIMNAGRQGRSFELNIEGEVVWEYFVPLRNGFRVEQGEELTTSQNFSFRFLRYPIDYPAFEGRDLVPGEYLELNPNEEFCTILTSTEELTLKDITLFPNPATGYCNVEISRSSNYFITSTLGSVCDSGFLKKGVNYIDVSKLAQGVYFIIIDNTSYKLIIQ